MHRSVCWTFGLSPVTSETQSCMFVLRPARRRWSTRYVNSAQVAVRSLQLFKTLFRSNEPNRTLYAYAIRIWICRAPRGRAGRGAAGPGAGCRSVAPSVLSTHDATADANGRSWSTLDRTRPTTEYRTVPPERARAGSLVARRGVGTRTVPAGSAIRSRALEIADCVSYRTTGQSLCLTLRGIRRVVALAAAVARG